MNCPKLQNITWVLRLEMLERLVVSHCDEMQQIIEEVNCDEETGVQKLKV
jgi:disease resistance protein RPS2